MEKRLIKMIKQLIGRVFYVGEDKASEQETIDRIKDSVDFRGAKLWILIFAIFVASLGLNTNSTAVIIGAMLISPIMGPIMGMGLGVGINDFELFKRSLKSFVTATIFSVLTATIYFLITPLAEAQSELLARTAPTIYDVFIALCGGLAGIIATCSISQRNGNVIPGVAIATALMPPICTTGFGIATGNWLYAAGAFYLYMINTIFISLATVIGVHIMHFSKKEFRDPKRERRVKQIIATIAVVTMVPASILTYQLVRETVFENKANSFIVQELESDTTRIVTRDIRYKDKTINVVLFGKEVRKERLDEIRKRLEKHGLEGTKLSVVQGGSNLDSKEIQTLLKGNTKLLSEEIQTEKLQREKAERIKKQWQPVEKVLNAAESVQKECRVLFPEVNSLHIGYGINIHLEKEAPSDTTTLISIRLKQKMNKATEKKLKEWLKQKIQADSLVIYPL